MNSPVRSTWSSIVIILFLVAFAFLIGGIVTRKGAEDQRAERADDDRSTPVEAAALPAAGAEPAAAKAPADPGPAAAAGGLVQLPRDLDLSTVPERVFGDDLERDALLQQARQRSKDQGGWRFAEAIPVRLTPQNSGVWDRAADGRPRWRLQVRSPEAMSLNFGFSLFEMPEGGSLTLSRPGHDSPYRAFTAADNEEHGQLWTPLLAGEVALLKVELADDQAIGELGLELASVNHGFRPLKAADDKIGSNVSGNCNIDVICGAGDDLEIIDVFRDQIRSVGAYTVAGQDFCSGALINNTSLDNTPYFLTADHCSVSAANAASVVIYWNFENSTCRPRDPSACAASGDGPLSQFNSGSIFRADFAATDFTVLELDDPIAPDVNVFLAGWDKSGTEATTAVAIHHPSVAEKRISFEFDETTTTSYSSTSVPGDGTHLRVADWDLGTTEGGSSGSPLFDESGRIIGQLHGGGAACGNNESDWYGRLSTSWNGGGSAPTRLSDWLDPTSSGVTTLDGVNLDQSLSIDHPNIVEGNSGTTLMVFTVTLNDQTSETVEVDWATSPGTATAGVDFDSANGTLQFAPNITTQTVEVTVHGDTTPEEHETLSVVLTNPTNAVMGSGTGTGTILNDDFITPVITSSSTTPAVLGRHFTYQATANHTPESFALDGTIPAGMMIDSEDGLVSWTPMTTGSFAVDVVALNPAGEDRLTLTINVGPNDVLTAVDIDAAPVPIVESCVPWFSQASSTVDGIDAAQSGAISHNESSWFELTVEGPDTLSFWWKVSCEQSYDFLILWLDGVANDSLTGITGWVSKNVTIPDGTHTVRWEYLKDYSVDGGDDRGWVDGITLATHPLITSAKSVQAAPGAVFFYHITTSRPADTITVTGLPAGLLHDGNGLISGVIPAGDFQFDVTASNPAGSDMATVTVDVIAPPDIADAIELDPAPGSLLVTSGNAPWFSQSAVNHDGVDAAQSGSITNNQSSAFQLPVQGPGSIHFWWKVDSQSSSDYLRFRIDGTQIGSISGSRDWIEVEREIPAGRHTLEWAYTKDASGSSGQDAAWVDQLTLDLPANSAPELADFSFGVAPDTAVTLSQPELLAYVTEPDGDPVVFSGVGGSANGGTVTLESGGLRYQPPGGFTGRDTFPLTVTDEWGLSADGTAAALVGVPSGTGQSTVAFQPNGSVDVMLKVAPGQVYQIQRSTDALIWIPLGTTGSGPDGLASFNDPSPPYPTALYRLVGP